MADRVITILVIMLAANLFLFLKLFGRQSFDVFIEKNRTYYFVLPTLAGLVMSLFMLYLEGNLFKRIERSIPFYLQLFLRWLIGSFIIGLVALLADSIISMINGIDFQTAISKSLLFLLSDLFISFYLFFVLAVIFLHFVKQLGEWFGYGVLMNYFMGKYNQPLEQEKVFMFIDLKNSTGIAEQLGNRKYSMFLNSCFADLSTLIEKYNGKVYQFVGDEVVLTWESKDVQNDFSPIRLFFEFQKLLLSKKQKYISQFGVQPYFKCSLHSGWVILTRVGGRQKEVAYHGDVLNTAARMLELCNQYNESFLVSENIVAWGNLVDNFNIRFLSEVILRGKKKGTKVYSISE